MLDVFRVEESRIQSTSAQSFMGQAFDENSAEIIIIILLYRILICST